VIFQSVPNPEVIISPQHFSHLSKLVDRHLPQLSTFLNDLMTHADKAELRRGTRTRTGIILEEGSNSRTYTSEMVKLIRKDLDKSKKELSDALSVQDDLALKYVELQMQHHTLMAKYEELRIKSNACEEQMTQIQDKMIQIKLAK